MELEAVKLSEDDWWGVRPKDACGTLGWVPYAWTLVFVKANTKAEAIRKASLEVLIQRLQSEQTRRSDNYYV